MKKNHDTEHCSPEDLPKKEGEKNPNPTTEEKLQDVKTKEQAEQLLRLRADFENIKKRLERDKQEAIKFANEKLLVEILSIVYNFDRAMTSLSEGHDPGKVKQGLKRAQGEIHQILEAHGVDVSSRLPIVVGAAQANIHYLETKRAHMGHLLPKGIAQGW